MEETMVQFALGFIVMVVLSYAIFRIDSWRDRRRQKRVQGPVIPLSDWKRRKR